MMKLRASVSNSSRAEPSGICSASWTADGDAPACRSQRTAEVRRGPVHRLPGGEQADDNSPPNRRLCRRRSHYLGYWLRTLRQARGLSQRELSGIAQIDPADVGRIERGGPGIARFDAIEACDRAVSASGDDPAGS
jgi:hypothetical protein